MIAAAHIALLLISYFSVGIWGCIGAYPEASMLILGLTTLPGMLIKKYLIKKHIF
jgi:hypothetical protein